MGHINWVRVGLLAWSRLTVGLVTLKTIGEMTDITKECTEEIVKIGDGIMEMGHLRVGVDGLGQVRLGPGGGAGEDNDGEVEDVVAAALRAVDGKLLQELNVPLDKEAEKPNPKPSCPTIINDYHAFLASTTVFLNAIQNKQQIHRWDGTSPVFHALGYLQALWASRKANEQNRSFIEQQMALYSSTDCFGKDNEVLRRSAEIVEYMNDLIDSFG